jgi:hypothetical protein
MMDQTAAHLVGPSYRPMRGILCVGSGEITTTDAELFYNCFETEDAMLEMFVTLVKE